MEAMEAPAASSISSKAGPAARKFWPSTVSGEVMQRSLEAKPPASQASASTRAPPSSITALIISMYSESLRRWACSWLRTRPGIRVAENSGWRPLA